MLKFLVEHSRIEQGLGFTMDFNWRHIYMDLCKISTEESPFGSDSKSGCLQHTAPPDLSGLLIGFKPFQSSLKITIIFQVFYLFSISVDDSGTVTSSAGTTCQAHTHHYSNLGVMKSCIECCAYFRDAHSPPPLQDASIHHAQVPAVIQSFNSHTSEVCLTRCFFSPPNHCCSERTTHLQVA